MEEIDGIQCEGKASKREREREMRVKLKKKKKERKSILRNVPASRERRNIILNILL